jgi:P pilus assembly chaperone PapD
MTRMSTSPRLSMERGLNAQCRRIARGTRTVLQRLTCASALAIAYVALPAATARAVTVSPTAVYISAKSPSALLTLINTGSRPEEIELSIGFGYPVSDSAGVLRVDIVDTAASGEPSLTSYLRVFPRRLVLQPGQRQVVRVMVTMPPGAGDGEYWGRVLVKSRGGEPPIEQAQGDVKMQLSLETTFATAVFYHKGDVKTGIRVPTVTAKRLSDGAELTIDLERDGNSAFLGRVHAELLDASGKTVAEVEDVVAVYRALRRRFLLRSTAPIPAGAYTVRYLVDTERPDLPPQGPIKAVAVRGTVAVR